MVHLYRERERYHASYQEVEETSDKKWCTSTVARVYCILSGVLAVKFPCTATHSVSFDGGTLSKVFN